MKGQRRILSGMRPTGRLHIGHWFGALKQWTTLQDEAECFFMVADLHALTTPTDVSKIREQMREMLLDWLAAGLDPAKCTIFVQSEVPEHAELALLLGMITSTGALLRIPTYKEKLRLHGAGAATFGLLGYPVLLAADILLYKANEVPVGADQIPHIEFARDLAHRFNERYGEIFPKPRVLLTETPKIMGLDRPLEKMSKSLGEANFVALSDSPAEIRAKIRAAVTDVGPQKVKRMSPGVRNLFLLLKLFSKPATLKHFQRAYQEGKIRYEELKETLALDIGNFFSDFRVRRQELATRPELLEALVKEGQERARAIAATTLTQAKAAVGLGHL